ncbi:MAG: SDR family oxidoreductase [Clostridia bacterium]|nr:SDR family oxidoreductase [Clostridiales bacterium]MBQ7917852.1 SDR family oxidoreductase [Clostridia bacterium]
MIRKSVIISGGFGDIGKATAEKFAQNGYNIALTYLSTFDTEFIEKLKSYNIEVLALPCDQTNESNIISFLGSVFKEFEYVDAFVACAGRAEPVQMLIDKPTETIDEIININLRGTILFNKAILKYFMEQKHGSIVNVSSIYGISGGSLESVYSACKAGIIGLTKSLSVESAPFVRVNAVAPGCIETKMTSNLTDVDKDCIIDSTPLDRIGTPADVANSIYFLASEESGFITGEVLSVTGGVARY